MATQEKINVGVLTTPIVLPDDHTTKANKERMQDYWAERLTDIANLFYEVIQGKRGLVFEGHRIESEARNKALVFFKPDRIETYDGGSEYLVIHFPQKEGYWGINEVLTEVFSFFSQNNGDAREKTIFYSDLFLNFDVGVNLGGGKGVRTQSLFQYAVGHFLGCRYKLEKFADIGENTQYTYDIQQQVNEGIEPKHFIAYIANTK